VYGQVHRDWSRVGSEEEIDLAAAVNGALPVICNDMFFSHMGNLLMPGRGINMGDGWETKRNRKPNNRDWVILRLAHTGMIHKILVDTCHFKGNYPDSCFIEGLLLDGPPPADWQQDLPWKTILPQSKLQADHEHWFNQVENQGPFNYVRLSIFPDGGVSRLRLMGKVISG
jgi:allantoicase